MFLDLFILFLGFHFHLFLWYFFDYRWNQREKLRICIGMPTLCSARIRILFGSSWARWVVQPYHSLEKKSNLPFLTFFHTQTWFYTPNLSQITPKLISTTFWGLKWVVHYHYIHLKWEERNILERRCWRRRRAIGGQIRRRDCNFLHLLCVGLYSLNYFSL